MRTLLVVGAMAAGAALCQTLPTAAASTGTPGQPNQSCQTVFPSGVFTPQGFNTAGFNHAITVYAGTQPQNSSNPNSVSQYDVACFQASQR